MGKLADDVTKSNPYHRCILDGDRYFVMCPGCKHRHNILVNTWSFNGDYENPTFNPSILVYSEWQGKRTHHCHSFIKDGRIQFLNDCEHSLAGTTVDLPTVSEWEAIFEGWGK